MKEILEDNAILNKLNTTDPVYTINEREFNKGLIQFGSLVSILKNKRINQTMLLVTLLEDQDFTDCFKQISEVDNTRVLIHNLIIRFPILCKSKIVKNKIKELDDDKKRRRLL